MLPSALALAGPGGGPGNAGLAAEAVIDTTQRYIIVISSLNLDIAILLSCIKQKEPYK